MRNLKKFLALVLAMMMVFSLILTVNANRADWSSSPDGTGYNDDGQISTKYDEAVQVLDQLGVFRGKSGKTFDPQDEITRAEVAAIVYRIATGDVKDELVKQDGGYTMYDDIVDKDYWANPYINYVTIGNYMVGVGGNQFAPDRKVTGYEVLATILRAIGYDKNGEFRGSTWKTYTSSKARDLGITDGITATELNDYATRELVAELLFRVIAKTSTVRYNAQYRDYEDLYTTLGYNVFGLSGAIKGDTDTARDAGLLAGFTAMSTRADADVDHVYDAPEAKWYKNSNKSTQNLNTDTIYVTFHPVQVYTTSVTGNTIYADAKTAGATMNGTALDFVAYNVDGKAETTEGSAIAKDGGALASTGNGVLTELYVVNGKVFITVVNTYVAQVATAWSAKTGTITLRNDSAGNVDGTLSTAGASGDPSNAGVVVDEDGVTNGISRGAVVLYHKYEGTASGEYFIDVDTIHTAEMRDVTVTGSYLPGADSTATSAVASSYFKAGSATYRYNAKYGYTLVDGSGTYAAPPALNDKLILHSELINARETRQLVYMDDYGYVMYTKAYDLPDAVGYLVVYSGGYSRNYGQGGNWLAKYNVVLPNGTYTTVEGAIAISTIEGANGYYSDTTSSGGYIVTTPGLYGYKVIDGNYALYEVRTDTVSDTITGKNDYMVTLAANATLAAGDPDGVNTGTHGVLSDDTQFIIAKYNAYNNDVIESYIAKTGLKNIPDLAPAAGKRLTIQYVYNSTGTEIETVFVLGAVTQTGDEKGTAYPTTGDVFYLADATPEEEYNEYDRHQVVKAGSLSWMNFVKGAIADSTAATGDTAPAKMTAGKFYHVLTTVENEVRGVELVKTVENIAVYEGVSYVAGGVLKATNNSTKTVGETVDTAGNYIVLADNCQVYYINHNTGAVKLIDAEDIDSATDPSGLLLGTDTAFDVCVAAVNGYGYATVIYVVSAA